MRISLNAHHYQQHTSFAHVADLLSPVNTSTTMPKEAATKRKSAKSAEKATGGKRKKGSIARITTSYLSPANHLF